MNLPDFPRFTNPARCATAPDPDLWFPDVDGSGATADDAKAVCFECPAFAECRAYALDTTVDGVWGGLSAAERQRVRGAEGITLPSSLPPKCSQGHAYTPENTVYVGAVRRCRTCRAMYSRVSKARARARRRGVVR